MILVAFVLVLVATVMLIIGTFFDGGVAFIWISIGACVATFGVLAASYFARRRGADDHGARPQPLGAGESRPAAARPAPRATTVGAGGTATATRERTETEPEVEPDVGSAADTAADEPTVTIVPSADEESATAADTADTQEIERVETDEEPEPAPRRVAPRRVVRRAPAPAAQDAAEGSDDEAADTADAPTWPSRDDDESQEADAPAAAAGTPQVVRSSEGGPTRKVVRRAAPAGGTRKVVRRAPGSGGTRVVRRSGAAGTGGAAETGGAGEQRTVKRVVRRAPASSGADAEQQPAPKKSPDRSGTRGKRARAVLSQIKGVGPAKQDALLKRFGSLEAMAEASIEDLAEVKGVGESVATAIKKTLKDR